MNRYAVTAIMPALNEAGNLVAAAANVLSSFQRLEINGELIVVNDGSSDQTGEIAEQLSASNDNVSVLHHERPQGIGGSFWHGVRVAQGDTVTMIPGDGENDAAEILRYLPMLSEVDIVIPFIYNREVRSTARRLLSIVYREIIKASFGLSLNYMNGTVMYRRCIFAGIELKNGGFFFQSELLIKTIKRGYLYAEVPCALRTRESGDSSATSWSSLRRVMRGYLETFREMHLGPSPTGEIAAGSATARRLQELAQWNG
jgi:glycosyltransferase involved in cell wall biosynthesis